MLCCFLSPLDKFVITDSIFKRVSELLEDVLLNDLLMSGRIILAG